MRLEVRITSGYEADVERMHDFLCRALDLDEPVQVIRYHDNRGFVIDTVLVDDPDPLAKP